VEKRFGRIDILINNAGIGQGQVRPYYHAHPPKFYEVTPSQWSRAIAVNANAVFLLSRAVVKPMIDRKWGRIINITTSLGTMLHGGSTPYGPSKASAEALSSVMAADLEGTGVTVNVIIPGGAVNTPMIPAEALPAMRCYNPK
jgi:NAD(P)-dependent dehydrogenase (short-subunit alcohol dehydrogenase family)